MTDKVLSDWDRLEHEKELKGMDLRHQAQMERARLDFDYARLEFEREKFYAELRLRRAASSEPRET